MRVGYFSTNTAGGISPRAATLDVLGDGRLRLGVAVGWLPEEVPVTMFCWGREPGQPSLESLKEYADERIVVCPPTI
jgi:alkanesulfonate monooxygenase SsuD/methylene tetrahydromethanopterin reductase-like flavin-dependent oxidoreductase (luciferase family)